MCEPELDDGKHISMMWMLLQRTNDPRRVECIKMTQTPLNMWVATFSFPLSTSTEDLECWFIADICTPGWTKWTTTYKNVKNGTLYKISDNIVQRVVWDDKSVPLKAFINHYKDIVVNSSERFSIQDCVMQVEHFSQSFKMNKRQAAFVLRYVLESRAEKNKRHQLLIFVLLGHLFRSIEEIDKTLLTESVAVDILAALRCFRFSDLTSSCSAFMFNLAGELCKVVQGHNHSFLTFVCATYPFFDEKQIFEELINMVRKNEVIVPKHISQKSESDIIQLFKVMIDKSSNPDTMTLMNTLLRHMPPNLSLKVYVALKDKGVLCNSEQNAVWKIFDDCINGSLTSYLKSTHTTCAKLRELWQTLKMCSELMQSALSEFEKTIIDKISKADQNDMNIIENILEQDKLYESLHQRIEVIKSLVKIKDSSLHVKVFEIAKTQKFAEATNATEPQYFRSCFENAFLYFKRGSGVEKRLADVYLYLCSALKLPIVIQLEDLKDYLDALTVDFLKHCDFKNLLRRAKYLEEITEKHPYIGECFRSHIRKLFQQQRVVNYYEVLMHLCGTAGRLWINSR